jgi:hypothetical protein
VTGNPIVVACVPYREPGDPNPDFWRSFGHRRELVQPIADCAAYAVESPEDPRREPGQPMLKHCLDVPAIALETSVESRDPGAECPERLGNEVLEHESRAIGEVILLEPIKRTGLRGDSVQRNRENHQVMQILPEVSGSSVAAGPGQVEIEPTKESVFARLLLHERPQKLRPRLECDVSHHCESNDLPHRWDVPMGELADLRGFSTLFGEDQSSRLTSAKRSPVPARITVSSSR